MSAIDNGGPAFPLPVQDDRDCNFRFASGYGGMTLRDYFAAAALQGNLASNAIGYEYTGENALEKAANEAYRYADAMLAARKEAQP